MQEQLFKPKQKALDFFNGFSNFGTVEAIEEIQTTRLDDVENLDFIDFVKMDVQGAELEILKNGDKNPSDDPNLSKFENVRQKKKAENELLNV